MFSTVKVKQGMAGIEPRTVKEGEGWDVAEDIGEKCGNGVGALMIGAGKQLTAITVF